MRTTFAIFPDPLPLFSGLPGGAGSTGPSRRHWASWPKRRPRPCWPCRREGVPGECVPTTFLKHPQDSTYQDLSSALTPDIPPSTPPSGRAWLPWPHRQRWDPRPPGASRTPWSCWSFWRGWGQGKRSWRGQDSGAQGTESPSWSSPHALSPVGGSGCPW